MANDISNFKLTKENAKEYFFLNQCRIAYIDHGDLINADKFRSYNFDDATLNDWINEWLNVKLADIDFKSNLNAFSALINDLGYRTDCSNAKKIFSVYNDLKCDYSDKKRINLLFRHEYSEVLKMHFYYGLILIAAKNNMVEELKPLCDELHGLLEPEPQEVKKEYEKYLKKLFKTYGIKFTAS